MVPPLRGGDFFSLDTRGVAARHPWLFEWHPFRMRQSRARQRIRLRGEDRIVARTGNGGWDASFVPDGTGAAGFDQPTVRNGGLLSVVPKGLQRGACGSVSQRSKRSESGCDVVLEDIGGEMLTRLKCPVFREGAGGRGCGSAYCGNCGGAFGGREFCRLGPSSVAILRRVDSRRNSRLGNLRYSWRNAESPGSKTPLRTYAVPHVGWRAQRSKKLRKFQNGFGNRCYKLLRENV